jgi:hypothetical protein
MTRTASIPDLRRLPRFTFAGRGCRDPRREPRRRPVALLTRPAPALPAAPAAPTPVSPAAPTTPKPAAADRPPPAVLTSAPPVPGRKAGLGYRPGRGGHRKG